MSPRQTVVGAGRAGVLGGIQGARGAIIPWGAVVFPPGGVVSYPDGAEVSGGAGGALRHAVEAVVGSVAAGGGLSGPHGTISSAGANHPSTALKSLVVISHLEGGQ